MDRAIEHQLLSPALVNAQKIEEQPTALLDIQEGPGKAIDYHHIAEELWVPDWRNGGIRDVWARESIKESTRIWIEQGTVCIE